MNFLKTALVRTSKYKKPIIIFGIISITLATLTALYIYELTTTKTYYIAYVGRYRTPNFDRLNELALEKYLDELNADFNSVRLKLKKFNNEGNSVKSNQIYEQISKDKRIVAVVDNTWGSELQKVAKFIGQEKVPVIAINADKRSTDFSNNAIFIGHDNNVPKKVTEFSNKILKNKHIIFITEEDFDSKNVFEEEFKNSGTGITRFGVNSSVVNQDEETSLFSDLDLELEKWQQREEKPTVIINTHAFWGVKIIDYLDTKYRGITILGGPYISNSNHDEFGENDSGNRLIMLTNPGDAITHKIYTDLKNISFVDSGTAGMRNAQLFVKRCLDAISIIRGVFTDELSGNLKSTISRSDFVDFFQKKLINNKFISKYDIYSFDKDLLLLDDKNFEELRHGKKLSYSAQLNPQSDKVIPNIYFGIDIVNISNVDITNKSFHVDFFYWLIYNKPIVDNKPDNNVEKYIHFYNEKQQNSGQEPIRTTEDDKTVYKLYKKSADFTIDVDSVKFPFDNQELKIELALIEPSEHVLISFDYESFNESKKRFEKFNIDDWKIKDSYFTVDNFITTSFRGELSLVTKEPKKFKRLIVRMPIERRFYYPFITIILPLAVIGFFAIALLFIKDNSFAEISSAIFLTIVTYSFSFAQLTPRTNILTIAHILFYLTFFIVLLIFLKVILFNSSLISEDFKGRANNKTNRIGLIALCIYGLLIFVILMFGLFG